MNLERSLGRARALFTVISIFGVLVALAGVACIAAAFANPTGGPHAAAAANPPAVAPVAEPMHPDQNLLLAGIIALPFGLLLTAFTGLIAPITMLAFRRAIDERWRYEQLIGAVENQRQAMESVRESVSLSDAAKQIAYRHKDREALRRAIHEDLEKQDYEAAISLVDEMERRFGYREEAGSLRDQIEQARRSTVEQRISDARGLIEDMEGRHEWAEALREAEKLRRLYPDRADVRSIPEEIAAARDRHKLELLKLWKDAVAKDDVDRSVTLLKQLDQYLTPGEAEAYKESARDVFKKRLQQLGVQFALHVHDKNWTEAFRIGQQITDEFPNTRIAAEVRDRLEVLREKAAQPAGV